MTDLKTQIREYLLNKGLIEQQTASGICFFYRNQKGRWDGTYWAEVKFPKYSETSNKIEISTGYSGAYSGDEGYDIARYKGGIISFEDFSTLIELTSFNSQLEKGKNQYIFSQSIADYKG